MSGLEFNKIFAAVLVAGIVAMFSGFIAEQLIHTHELEKAAVELEGGPVEGGIVRTARPDPILHLLADAGIAQGEKLSRACAACHSFEQGGPHRVGPNLWAILGAAKAGKSGFDYSDAMKGKSGNWTYEDLNKFLWKPKVFIEGTNMNYIGLKKPEDRAAIIAWLRTLGSNAPLPGEADIAREQAELAPPPEEETSNSGEAPATGAEKKPAEKDPAGASVIK